MWIWNTQSRKYKNTRSLPIGMYNIYGKTKGGQVHLNGTWWWNDVVDTAVKEKRHKWSQWEQRGSNEEYNIEPCIEYYTI